MGGGSGNNEAFNEWTYLGPYGCSRGSYNKIFCVDILSIPLSTDLVDQWSNPDIQVCTDLEHAVIGGDSGWLSSHREGG